MGSDDMRVKLGDTVIFDVNGEKQMFITIKPKSKVKLGGSQVSVEPLVGCLYGTLFTLSPDGESLVQTEHTPSAEWDAPVDASKNNANLVDRGENQQLTNADIEEMRLAGKSGEEIIAALAANSATFGTKTEFSQEKYKKRKAKKYLVTACVRRPTAASVCEAYYSKQPGKIGFLRLDSLSLVLSLANIGAHARVLVIDACGGLVTAAVAERLGGFGSVTAAYVGPRPPGSEALRQFNFSAQLRSAVRTVALQHLVAEAAAAEQARTAAVTPQGEPGQQQDLEEQQQQHVVGVANTAEPALAEAGAAAGSGPLAMQLDAPQAAGPATEPHQSTPAAVMTAKAAASGAPGPEGTEGIALAKEAPAKADLQAQVQECQQQQQQQQQQRQLPPFVPFTCCIVAAPALGPSAALAAALPLLASSAPFAVYHHWQQPLAEAMAELQKERRALGLTLQESWWRDYQVLPARTHPLMQMNHGGGYLLSGTTVKQDTEEAGGRPRAAAPQGQKPAAGRGQANRKRKGR